MLKLAVFLLLSSAGFASTNCQSSYQTHNSGHISFCITENGNVVNLEGPPGWDQIQGGEGYAVCAFDGSFSYFDIGGYGDSGNWSQSVISQPKGPNTFPYSISRTTSDGLYKLTQAFKLISGGKALGVTWSVTGPELVYLVRWAEVSPQSNQMGNHTSATAFIWTPGRDGLALTPKADQDLTAGVVQGGAQNPCFSNGAGPNMAIRTSWVLQPNRKTPAYFEYSVIR